MHGKAQQHKQLRYANMFYFQLKKPRYAALFYFHFNLIIYFRWTNSTHTYSYMSIHFTSMDKRDSKAIKDKTDMKAIKDKTDMKAKKDRTDRKATCSYYMNTFHLPTT